MVPTGKVAYNVRGTTIHTAFHISANQPLQDYKPLSFDVLNTYRMKYRELEWIWGDEISMVSNDLWRYLHLCLQEIKQNKDPFGGVNIIAIGNIYQLQPVKGNYVFMDLRHNCEPLSINLWCEYLTMYELEEIMHQKNDRTFAELLNRFHVGKHTAADFNLLAARAITSKDGQSLNHIPHFFPTRKKVQDYNETILQRSAAQKIIIVAIDIPPSSSSQRFMQQLQAAIDKHKPESTGGLPKYITVAISHQYNIISNIAVNDGIMNGAECCIKIIQPQTHNTNFPAIIWVQFEDLHIGKAQHQKYNYLQSGHILQNWTPIFAQKRTFLIKDVWVTQVQFPVHCAAACTIHVAQSATFHDIYIDMNTNTSPPKHWWQHMYYVALSQVTTLSGLHLKNLNCGQMCISKNIVNYIVDARREHNLTLSYVPLYNYGENQLKVKCNNTRSLKTHYVDVKSSIYHRHIEHFFHISCWKYCF